MRNSNRGRRTPYVRPIQRVELSESNVKLRLILVVVLLAVATVAVIVGVSSALKTEATWQRIEVQSLKKHCGDDFVFDYDFTDTGSGATAGFKKLTALYSTACEDAFRIFSPDEQGGVYANVHDLNARPNETVTVEPALYQALTLVQQYQSRSIYLGGVYAEYGRIFSAETEVEAASYDPAQNEEQREYIMELAAFAVDPAMVDVQLLGENRVKLLVSEEYHAFAKANEIEDLIDFGWMKNAFIADFLAQTLIDNGFTNGYLASFDGFTRNLDGRGNTYSQNVFDRSGSDIYIPAVLTYTAPSAIVFLRDYPLSNADASNYYAFSGGRIASNLIDPVDGMDKASVDSLLAYAEDQSCAELLLQTAPVVIADEFSADPLLAMAKENIHSIWCAEQKVFYTDAEALLRTQSQENVTYTKVFAGE